MSCPANSSGLKSAGTVVLSRPGRLLGVELIADGTNAAALTIYDSSTAATTGTALVKLSIAATGVYLDAHLPDGGIVCNNGIYADVSGTGANFIVHYAMGG